MKKVDKERIKRIAQKVKAARLLSPKKRMKQIVKNTHKIRERNQKSFEVGDWIGTQQIEPPSGQKYMMAHVCKILKKGAWLLVEYGGYKDETIVEAKKCTLIRRD